MMKYAVGVDIGGTNSRVALVDENMNVIERVQLPTRSEERRVGKECGS